MDAVGRLRGLARHGDAVEAAEPNAIRCACGFREAGGGDELVDEFVFRRGSSPCLTRPRKSSGGKRRRRGSSGTKDWQSGGAERDHRKCGNGPQRLRRMDM
jgi:hypothetical protein